ncbi:MAG: hypothetical protein JEZ06_16405 [Anaerolineaceae bacterium]|nr:hypothetical protein [Anaerolineaceae bacterium]
MKWIPFLAFSFSVSLLVNFWVVFLLTLLKIYIRPVILILLLVEVLIILYIYRNNLNNSLIESSKRSYASIQSFFSRIINFDSTEDEQLPGKIIHFILILFLIISVFLAISWGFTIWRANLGTVFNSWDAVLSWNPWAVDWASNQIPEETQLYPQAIPANWSLSYILLNTHQVQTFAKSIMPLFYILVLVLMLDLSIDYKSYGFLIGIIIFRYMTKNFLGEFIAEGYMDIPAAAISFVAIYGLLKAQITENQHLFKMFIICSALSAASAALIKQAGGFILILLPLFLLTLSTTNPLIKGKEQWRLIGMVTLLGFLLAFPWYFFKWGQFARGLDNSNIYFLTQEIHKITSPIQRVIPSLLRLEKYLIVVLLALISIFHTSRLSKILTTTLGLGYTFIWTLYYSYDIRNIALAIPFLAISAGAAVEFIIEHAISFFEKLKLGKIRIRIFVIALIFLIAFLSFWLPAKTILTQQIDMQKNILAPDFNAELYQYIEKWDQSTPIKILSQYPISVLPGLETYQVYCRFDSLESFQDYIKEPSINHVLLPHIISDYDIHYYLENEILSGKAEEIFDNDEYGGLTLYRIY